MTNGPGYPRYLEHCVYYQDLGAHYKGFNQRHLPRARRPAWDRVEMDLKKAALFYRGVVVSDTDLNNNPLFHQLTRGGSAQATLRTALERGFLMRAARDTGDGPISQGDLWDQFKRNNPELARSLRKPRGHTQALDDIFNRVKDTYRPLTYKTSEIGAVFRNRVVIKLAELAKDEKQGSEVRTLARQVIDYAMQEDVDLRAAALTRIFLPNRKTDQSHKQVWDTVLNAFNGNVPAAFEQGRLMMRLHPEDERLPGWRGPEDETLISGLQAALQAGPHAVREIAELTDLDIPVEWKQKYRPKPEALESRTLEQLEEIREQAAERSNFLQERFECLRSAGAMEKRIAALKSAETYYLQELQRAGLVERLDSSKYNEDRDRAVYVRTAQQGTPQARLGLVLIGLGTWDTASTLLGRNLSLELPPSLTGGVDVAIPLALLLSAISLRQAVQLMGILLAATGLTPVSSRALHRVRQDRIFARQWVLPAGETVIRPYYADLERQRDELLSGL